VSAADRADGRAEYEKGCNAANGLSDVENEWLRGGGDPPGRSRPRGFSDEACGVTSDPAGRPHHDPIQIPGQTEQTAATARLRIRTIGS